MSLTEDQYLINRLKDGDKDVFSYLFQRYYKDLVLFGGTILPEKEVCEDIVQSVFLKLWKDRVNLQIETSLKSYLLRSVQNGCLDELRHSQVVQEHVSYTYSHSILDDVNTENYILYSDLRQHFQQALLQIPSTSREAFEMNRFEGLKYKEIAEKLNVSERTVEVRISKAIELLRKHLKDFLILLIYLGIR